MPSVINFIVSALITSLFGARQRSGAGTQTGTGQDVGAYEGNGLVVLDWINESGTTPTLDVKLQESDTQGGTYTDITGAAFTQSTTGSGVKTLALDLGSTKRWVRASATLAGTSPVYAFGVSIVGAKKTQP